MVQRLFFPTARRFGGLGTCMDTTESYFSNEFATIGVCQIDTFEQCIAPVRCEGTNVPDKPTFFLL